MSLQKLTAALVSGTQETSLALANLHFDFSLYKVEAPAEFKVLGQELTPARREAAEAGSPHITARKLGALFQQGLPEANNLFKAYGQRASQIATRRDVNPKGSVADGLFANLVGIDGTNIWAAATSGVGAIAVHLLACMLARMWSVSEATSIWVELVNERKQRLSAVKDISPDYQQCQEASRISLSRDQLAEWDASARAWLRAADEAMQSKQKQLMLILNNVDISVNKKPGLYDSVYDAWKSAMSAIDRLIQGMPQSIQDGAILLGLSAWHIYPDLLILGKTHTTVHFEDSLVMEGALLTIGLEMTHSINSSVYWSLPLSQHRYYGGAVKSERTLITQGNRITIQQLYQIAIGSLTKHWELDIADIASVLSAIWNYVCKNAQPSMPPTQVHWLQDLVTALTPVLATPDCLERKTCNQLFKFGARRCPEFMIPEQERKKITPLFGLTNFKILFPLLNTDGKVDVLRDIASEHESLRFVIRYRDKAEHWIYATAMPQSWHHDFRLASQTGTTRHARWFHYSQWKGIMQGSSLSKEEDVQSYDTDALRIEEHASTNSFVWCQRSGIQSKHNRGHPRQSGLTAMIKGTQAPIDLEDDNDDDMFLMDEESEVQTRATTYAYFAGDTTRAALFVEVHGQLSQHELTYIPEDSLKRLNNAMQKGGFNTPVLVKRLVSYVTRTHMLKSLGALATAAKIYENIPGATVSMEMTRNSLFDMSWVPLGQEPMNEAGFCPFQMDWARVFACIVLFESGSHVINPADFKSVMAMSVGDSLYIAAPLLSDPFKIPNPYEVRRIRGNVGKPGIAMLIPPENPRVKELELDNWHLINHAPFNGQSEDCFQATSLHLSFTGYTVPVELGVHGNRDAEIYFVESVVSVHNHGKWVADIDVLRHFYTKSCTRLRLDRPCNHTKIKQPVTLGIIDTMTAIDNWEELLDRSDVAGVVRTDGNWIGRLSTMTLSLQMGYPVLVLPNDYCWACAHKRREFSSGDSNILKRKSVIIN